MLHEGSIEAEVKVAHEEVYVGYGVWLYHFFLAEQSYVLQNALCHRQALIDSILA